VVDGLDIADRVRVWWKPSAAEIKAGAPDVATPYDGVITKVVDMPDGSRQHTVLYDARPGAQTEVVVHNLADGRRFQRVVTHGGVQATKPTAEVSGKAARSAQQKAAPTKLPPVTRARARAALMTQALDDALDACAEPLSVFNAVAYQLVGELSDSLECHSLEQLDTARCDFYRRELRMLAHGRFASHQRASSLTVETLEALKAENEQLKSKCDDLEAKLAEAHAKLGAAA
jgi:hypothetical protein